MNVTLATKTFPPRFVLLLVVTATLTVAPLFVRGVPMGFDLWFHVPSWIEVAQQWKQGILYPQWANGAEEGYGEPRFIFYPPASWLLGSALGSVLPWRVVPAVFAWLALFAAGLSMYRLAREFLAPGLATFAAVFYAANPYQVTCIYRRNSFAELLAAAVLPLVVLYALRLGHAGARSVVPLALALAAIFLIHVPAALIALYSLLLILVVTSLVRRLPRVILLGAAAVGLACLLAAFYLLPAVYEQRWLEPLNVLHEWLLPEANFLFTSASHAYPHFNLVISSLAVAEIILAAVAIFFSCKLRRDWPEMWWAAVTLAVVSTLLMFSLTAPVWRSLPGLEHVNSPWQWLFALNLVIALLLAASVGQFHRRFVLGLLVLLFPLAFLMAAAARMELRPARWLELISTDPEGTGYIGAPEYTPRGVDLFKIQPGIPQVQVIGTTSGGHEPQREGVAGAADSATTEIQVHQWRANRKLFSVKASAPTDLALRLFVYPAWRVEVNGRVAPVRAAPGSGHMILRVPQGVSEVALTFTRTPDRTRGITLSLLTAVFLLAARFVAAVGPSRRPRDAARTHSGQ
jgi:hypothetical protein